MQPGYTLETIKGKSPEDIMPVLKELEKLKDERKKSIIDALSDIFEIREELGGPPKMNNIVAIDESNVSQRLLECYQSTLQKLRNEKVIWLPRSMLYQLVAGLKTPFDFIH